MTIISCCSAFGALLEGLLHQLHDMEKVMLQHVKGTTVLLPEALHFLLPEPEGLVTAVFPSGVADSQLETLRKVRSEYSEDCYHLNTCLNQHVSTAYCMFMQKSTL